MRYYEITHRPRTQTATDRIAWNEPRHLQHDARGIWQRAQACVCLVKLTEPSHMMRIVPKQPLRAPPIDGEKSGCAITIRQETS